MEGLIVQVPAGAFDGDVTLSVSESEEENPFGESGVTGVYQLRGLPEKFRQPIRFSLKVRGDSAVTKGGIAGCDCWSCTWVLIWL